MATDYEARMDSRLVAWRAYIIDFGTSRQLSLGPGVQAAIPLRYAQVPRPLDMDYFDPYSWDVYCLGKLFEYMMRVSGYIFATVRHFNLNLCAVVLSRTPVTPVDYSLCYGLADWRGKGMQAGLPLSAHSPAGASGVHHPALDCRHV